MNKIDFYNDLIKSKIATRFSIPNIPEKWQMNNLEILAKNVIKLIFDRFNNLEITSGFRSLKLNSKVGGSKTSDHMLGCAVDFVNNDKNINECDIIEWIYNNIQFKKLIIENYPNGWIHISYDPEMKENSKILIFKDKNSKSYRKTDINEIYKFFGKQKQQPQQKKIVKSSEEQNSVFDKINLRSDDIEVNDNN